MLNALCTNGFMFTFTGVLWCFEKTLIKMFIVA